MVKKIFFFFSVVLFSAYCFAQGISAIASVDKQHYQVGDYINYSIKVNYPKNTTVFVPFIKDSLQHVSIIKNETSVTKQNGEFFSTNYNYILAGYDSTGITIPPIAVLYKTQGDTTLKSILTNPVSFTVSTLPVDTAAGIKDIKPPIKIPLDWKIILLWIFIILIILIAVYYLYRWYKKRKETFVPEKIMAKLPPHVVALNSLNELKEKNLWQKGMIKEYHTEITEIIRRYFEERFELPALELTTTEVTQLLGKKEEAYPVLNITYSFLTNADLVKFAKYNPDGFINEEMMKQAYEIVNRTKPNIATETTEELKDVQ